MHVHLSVVSSLVFPECPAVIWCTIPLSGSAAGLGERVESGRNRPASVRAGLFVCTHNNGWAGKSHLRPPLKVQSLGRVRRGEQTREGRVFFKKGNRTSQTGGNVFELMWAGLNLRSYECYCMK